MIYTCKPARLAIYVNSARKTMDAIKAETGADVIINGGLFDGAFNPVCHLKAGGKVYASDPYKYFGYGWHNGKADIRLTADYADLDNYICCVCMVREGKADPMLYQPDMGGVRPRTAIGLYPDGRVCFIYGTYHSPESLQKFCLDAGLDSAVMLDGGGSTQGITPSGTVRSSDGRIVQNYILAWLNPGTDTPDETQKGDTKMKVYISPSSQPANLYAAGGTNEQEQCVRIAGYAKAAFDRCGIECRVGKAETGMEGRVAESNAWGADIHLPIHTNAGGGHGAVVFVYSDARKALAQPVYDALQDVNLYKATYGVRVNSSLYECRNSVGKCIYVEAAFHDNAEEAAWIIAHVKELGEAIAKGVCKAVSVPFVPEKQTEQTDTVPAPTPDGLEARINALEEWAKGIGFQH